MLCAVVVAQAYDETFYSCSWDDTNKEVAYTWQTKYCTVIDGSHPDEWFGLTDGYYVVDNFAYYKVLNIVGSEVHLVLPPNTKLSVKHVKQERGHTLHIHAKSKIDEEMGQHNPLLKAEAPIRLIRAIRG